MNNYIEIIIGLLMAIMLVTNTVLDISRHEISVLLCMGVALPGSFILLISGERNLVQLALGLIPGLFIILISFLSKGRVGIGDGIIIIALGLLWGFDSTFRVLFIGMCMAGVFSTLMLSLRKWKSNTRLPFVPFLCGASGIVALFQVVGL